MCLTPRCWSQSGASADTNLGSQPERSKSGAVPSKMRQKLSDHWQKEKVIFCPLGLTGLQIPWQGRADAVDGARRRRGGELSSASSCLRAGGTGRQRCVMLILARHQEISCSSESCCQQTAAPQAAAAAARRSRPAEQGSARPGCCW